MDAGTALDLFGTAEPPAPYRLLRAGPLEVRFEAGNLRYVRFEGQEVLRAISYVVRDRDWGTLVPEIAAPEIVEEADRFRVAYRAVFTHEGVRLSVETEIRGAASGHLSFIAKAFADGPFETNRCGFTILHPIDGVAGAPVLVEHCDGTFNETEFPDLIEPWQPFKSIRALTHSPGKGLTACCRMEGEAFEMEDQRNWSDASYKTYVRPLELPWPYTLPDKESIEQSVTLTLKKDPSFSTPSGAGPQQQDDEVIQVAPGEDTGARFPKIGLLVDPEDVEAVLPHLDLVQEIAPQALLCHLDPSKGHDGEALSRFQALQAAVPATIDLEYVVACDGDLREEFLRLRDWVKQSGLKLASLMVCPSVDRQSTPPGSQWPDCPPLEDIYAAARQAFPQMDLGGGMVSYFTELNRKRPPLELLDFVSHGTNPIVHAADDDSVMESLETLPHITRSARAVMGRGMPYRLGLTSIGMRQNPYGSRTFANPHQHRICMSHEDPRQRGRFASAWTLGYAARIAPAGIAQWVPASVAGPRGVMNGPASGLLPVGQTVATLAGLSGAKVHAVTSSAPGKLAVLAVDRGRGSELLAANLTCEPLTAAWRGTVVLEPFEILWL